MNAISLCRFLLPVAVMLIAGCTPIQPETTPSAVTPAVTGPTATETVVEPTATLPAIVPTGTMTIATAPITQENTITMTEPSMTKPSPDSQTPNPQTPAPQDSNPQVMQAVTDLAARLQVGSEQITVVSAEPVVWPDGGLGCPQPGMVYTQVQQDGMKIVLSVGGREYHYHSGETRGPFLCENPANGG